MSMSLDTSRLKSKYEQEIDVIWRRIPFIIITSIVFLPFAVVIAVLGDTGMLSTWWPVTRQYLTDDEFRFPGPGEE